MPHPPSLKKARGLSLLEALVAFVVLALLAIPLFQVFGGAINNAGSSGAWSRAVQVAQNQLALASIAQPLSPATHSGKEGDMSWTVQVEEYIPPPLEGEVSPMAESLTFKLYRLRAEVRFPGVASTERTFSLETVKIGLIGLENM